MTAVRETAASRRIVVCVGSGGVGKTTVAAAIALDPRSRAAARSCCTIDPARRLANALGLSSLGNVESRVPDHKFADAGLHAKGELHAMMLDMKRTWDDLVTRHAPDPARRERILGTGSTSRCPPRWRARRSTWRWRSCTSSPPTATTTSSSSTRRRPRTRSTSSTRLTASSTSSGNDAARALLAPAIGAGKLGLRLAQLGGGFVAKTLARFTGQAALSDLGDFLQGFQGMYEGFKDRAVSVHALLSQPEVGFVLVASPSAISIDEALAFHERLHAE